LHRNPAPIDKKKTHMKMAAGTRPPLRRPPATGRASRQVNLQIHLRKIPLLAELSEEDMRASRATAHPPLRQARGRAAKRRQRRRPAVPAVRLSCRWSTSPRTAARSACACCAGRLLRRDRRHQRLPALGLGGGAERRAGGASCRRHRAAPVLALAVGGQPDAAHLAQKIQRDSEFRALLSIHNTSRRIYTFLTCCKEAAGRTATCTVVENLPTHQDIANMINTSRETVTRALLTLASRASSEGSAPADHHRSEGAAKTDPG
jgi:CRP/FNR family cyclic AMP-dependent transcriptional regulator